MCSNDPGMCIVCCLACFAIFLMRCPWPHEAISGVLQALSRMIPCTAGALGFVRINQMDATLYEVRHEWFTLWGLCAVYGVMAWLGTMCRPNRMKVVPVETGTPGKGASATADTVPVST